MAPLIAVLSDVALALVLIIGAIIYTLWDNSAEVGRHEARRQVNIHRYQHETRLEAQRLRRQIDDEFRR